MFLSIHAPWTDRERTKTQAERASEDIVQPKGVLADADAQWRVFAGLLKEHFGDGGGVVRHLHQVRESLEKRKKTDMLPRNMKGSSWCTTTSGWAGKHAAEQRTLYGEGHIRAP